MEASLGQMMRGVTYGRGLLQRDHVLGHHLANVEQLEILLAGTPRRSRCDALVDEDSRGSGGCRDHPRGQRQATTPREPPSQTQTQTQTAHGGSTSVEAPPAVDESPPAVRTPPEPDPLPENPTAQTCRDMLPTWVEPVAPPEGKGPHPASPQAQCVKEDDAVVERAAACFARVNGAAAEEALDSLLASKKLTLLDPPTTTIRYSGGRVVNEDRTLGDPVDTTELVELHRNDACAVWAPTADRVLLPPTQTLSGYRDARRKDRPQLPGLGPVRLRDALARIELRTPPREAISLIPRADARLGPHLTASRGARGVRPPRAGSPSRPSLLLLSVAMIRR